MKRSAFILLLLILGLSLPGAASAEVLPGCDRTIYIVTQGGWVRQIAPERGNQYAEDFIGPIPAFINEHVITPDLYFQDPTLYNPATSAEDALENVQVGINRACGFNDFVQLFINIINWGFSILAVVSVFFIMWGGFTLLISGGRSELIEAGKKTVQGTIVGIIVVLTAYIIVNFYMFGLVGDTRATFLGTTVPNPLGGTTCRQEFKEHNVIPENCSAGNLSFGCTDATNTGSVRNVQELLNKKCNGICGPANGCFGNQTAHCVRMFQAANAMEPTGTIDGVTAAAITNPALTNCFTKRRITENGQTREAKLTYQNPIGFPDFENVFPSAAVPSAFGSCTALTWPCIPAHGPFECPDDVVGGIRVTYEYSPTACP